MGINDLSGNVGQQNNQTYTVQVSKMIKLRIIRKQV